MHPRQQVPRNAPLHIGSSFFHQKGVSHALVCRPNPLRDALAELFPNATTAGVVVYDAEIDTSLLHLDGAPIVIWQNILTEAWKQSKVDALIAVAQQRYPTYAPLTAAIAHYRATPVPPLPATAAPTSPGQPTNTQQTATGRNIAQAGPGGSATVNDHSRHTVFDQRGQTVYGPVTNIAGGVHTSGGLFNSGIMTTTPAPTPADIMAELRKLLAQVTQAGQQGLLDEITTIDVESALRKAIALAGKPLPDRQAILTHLTTAQATVNQTAATNGLATAITAVIGLVQQAIG
ncbi:MAG: effector-associated domain EAD1-containing protein [Caldilineaceae bacterium]